MSNKTPPTLLWHHKPSNTIITSRWCGPLLPWKHTFRLTANGNVVADFHSLDLAILYAQDEFIIFA